MEDGEKGTHRSKDEYLLSSTRQAGTNRSSQRSFSVQNMPSNDFLLLLLIMQKAMSCSVSFRQLDSLSKEVHG